MSDLSPGREREARKWLDIARNEITEPPENQGRIPWADVLELFQLIEKAEKERDEAIAERDRLWCRALTTLDTKLIEQVTARFNEIRPDAATEDETTELAILKAAAEACPWCGDPDCKQTHGGKP